MFSYSVRFNEALTVALDGLSTRERLDVLLIFS
jgi:hypothetical protein